MIHDSPLFTLAIDAKADLLSKRSKSHGGTSALSDQVDVKPLVKHVLSKELQMYFERITEAVLSEDERLRSQAFESLRMDPGLHQLLPYFVQHIHKKVTQNHKDLDVLDAMLSMAHSLLNNQHLFVEPYVSKTVKEQWNSSFIQVTLVTSIDSTYYYMPCRSNHIRRSIPRSLGSASSSSILDCQYLQTVWQSISHTSTTYCKDTCTRSS